MSEILYEFTVETAWTIFSKYTSHVVVYCDHVDITRKGRIDSIPEKITVHFENVSSITYTKNTDYALSYIAFIGLSNAPSDSITGMNLGKFLAATSSANPWKDSFGIVFKYSKYEEGKPHYNKLNEIFEEFKRVSRNQTSHTISGENSTDKLKKIKELKDLGIISDSEYEEKRLKLLNEI